MPVLEYPVELGTLPGNETEAKHPFAWKGLVGAWASIYPTAHDLSGRGPNGVVSSGVGVEAGSWVFTDDNIALGVSAYSLAEGSVFLWLKITQSGLGRWIFDAEGVWDIQQTALNTYKFLCYDGSFLPLEGGTVVADEWALVGQTFDGSTQVCYVDGKSG